jgi:hypothetical protein
MIKALAERTQRYYQGTKVAIDPATIIMLIGVITEIIRIIQRCKQPEEVQICAVSPTDKEYRIISRAVRRKIGWIRWFREGTTITNAIFRVGMNSTVDEIKEAYKEIDDISIIKTS